MDSDHNQIAMPPIRWLREFVNMVRLLASMFLYVFSAPWYLALHIGEDCARNRIKTRSLRFLLTLSILL